MPADSETGCRLKYTKLSVRYGFSWKVHEQLVHDRLGQWESFPPLPAGGVSPVNLQVEVPLLCICIFDVRHRLGGPSIRILHPLPRLLRCSNTPFLQVRLSLLQHPLQEHLWLICMALWRALSLASLCSGAKACEGGRFRRTRGTALRLTLKICGSYCAIHDNTQQGGTLAGSFRGSTGGLLRRRGGGDVPMNG